MKRRLTSTIAAWQKRHSTILNARWIVGVLFIILISAFPEGGSANLSPADLSTQSPTFTPTVGLPATIIFPTYTPTTGVSLTPTNVPATNESLGGQQILVSTGNVLYVYTEAGDLLESYEIPYPVEPRPYIEIARDIIPGANRTIFVYNGSYDPYLSILDRDTGIWTHVTHSGWSTVAGVYHGGIGKFSKYVYVTDMDTDGDEESGIVRFNIRDASSDRYAQGHGWNTLTIGLDNLVYAYSSWPREVSVLDPLSMQILRGFELPTPNIWSIAVDEEGDIYGVDTYGWIQHFDNNGLLLESVAIGGNLSDIDISQNGQFVVSAWSGNITLLDEGLVIQNRFTVESNNPIFVAFLPAH